jgi:microcystin-dependent protein
MGAGPGLTPRSHGARGGPETLCGDANEKGRGFTEGDTTSAVMPPFTALNFIIALEGIYPSRS